MKDPIEVGKWYAITIYQASVKPCLIIAVKPNRVVAWPYGRMSKTDYDVFSVDQVWSQVPDPRWGFLGWRKLVGLLDRFADDLVRHDA